MLPALAFQRADACVPHSQWLRLLQLQQQRV